MPLIRPVANCLIGVAVWSVCVAIASSAEVPYYEKILLEKQIVPDVNGLRKYLQALHPSTAQRNEANRLIAQLESNEFGTREQATKSLLLMPSLPVDELTAALDSRSPEIRWRAKAILSKGRQESADTLFAAFKTINQKELVGLVEELLGAIPLCEERHLQIAVLEAIDAIAREEDSDVLRRGLTNKYVEVRVTAVSGLAQALKEEASKELLEIVNDSSEDDRVQVMAARYLADLGDRHALQVLAELLSSEDVYVRVDASLTLQDLTGQRFGFAAYDNSKRRAEVIDKWEAWIEGDGQTAELHFPLPKNDRQRGYLNGNTLLAYGYKNKVAEYAPDGKEIWTYSANGAWSAEKLSNGNVLIAAYSDNNVVEVDAKGKVIWKYEVNTPLNTRPLPSGNILVSSHGTSQVQEVNRQGKVVWHHATTGNVCDAHRLDNGNTIYCAGSQVIEITPGGKKVWEYLSGQPFGIQPLASGNILICDLGGKVIEVTRAKKEVWEFAEPNPVDAFRLPNGNTLITGGQRFVEVSPEKKVVWKKEGCNYGSARR